MWHLFIRFQYILPTYLHAYCTYYFLQLNHPSIDLIYIVVCRYLPTYLPMCAEQILNSICPCQRDKINSDEIVFKIKFT